jgi:hypothetical protein
VKNLFTGNRERLAGVQGGGNEPPGRRMDAAKSGRMLPNPDRKMRPTTLVTKYSLVAALPRWEKEMVPSVIVEITWHIPGGRYHSPSIVTAHRRRGQPDQRPDQCRA